MPLQLGSFLHPSIKRYNNHAATEVFDRNKLNGHPIFHPSLSILMDRDIKANEDDADVLDGDPICSCHDWNGIYGLRIVVGPVEAGRAQVDAAFDLSPRLGQQSRSPEAPCHDACQ